MKNPKVRPTIPPLWGALIISPILKQLLTFIVPEPLPAWAPTIPPAKTASIIPVLIQYETLQVPELPPARVPTIPPIRELPTELPLILPLLTQPLKFAVPEEYAQSLPAIPPPSEAIISPLFVQFVNVTLPDIPAYSPAIPPGPVWVGDGAGGVPVYPIIFPLFVQFVNVTLPDCPTFAPAIPPP